MAGDSGSRRSPLCGACMRRPLHPLPPLPAAAPLHPHASPHPCTPCPSAMKRTYATDFGMTFSFPLIARCAVGHPHPCTCHRHPCPCRCPTTPVHPCTHETSSFQPRPVAHPPGSGTKSNDRPEASPILNVTFMRMSEDRSIHPPTFLHPLSPLASHRACTHSCLHAPLHPAVQVRTRAPSRHR